MLGCSGAVTSAEKIDPFGAIQSATGTPFPFGYTGQQTDQETGLQYLRARYYDPSQGRFTSQDPLAGLLPDPASQHKYIYGLDNPLRFLDPTGKCGEDQQDTGTDCIGPAPGMPGNWGTQEVPGPAGVGTGPDPAIDPSSPLADPEVQQTLQRIAVCGPFPYAQDGTVFQNRGNPLPAAAPNYYHEYTVDTPGAPNRGARRIVTGAGGETYYTDDHYATFVLLDPASIAAVLRSCGGGLVP